MSCFSIQGADLLIQVPQVHPQNLQVVMMKKENQEDQSPGLRDQGKKGSTNQEPSTLTVTMKLLLVLCHFPDSLGV